MMRLLLAALLFLVGCRTAVPPQPDLGLALDTAVISGNPFRLADVTTLEWDTVHIFPPYSSADYIESSLGFAYNDSGVRDIERRDDVVLFLFVKDGRVTHSRFVPRAAGDFSQLDAARGLTPAEAVFAPVATDDGRWLITHPIQP